jgi:hypothetical protein
VPVTGLISGDPNGARDFDGVDDRVEPNPGAFGTPTALSVEAWVRVDTIKPSGEFHFLVTDALNDLSADGFSSPSTAQTGPCCSSGARPASAPRPRRQWRSVREPPTISSAPRRCARTGMCQRGRTRLGGVRRRRRLERIARPLARTPTHEHQPRPALPRRPDGRGRALPLGAERCHRAGALQRRPALAQPEASELPEWVPCRLC